MDTPIIKNSKIQIDKRNSNNLLYNTRSIIITYALNISKGIKNAQLEIKNFMMLPETTTADKTRYICVVQFLGIRLRDANRLRFAVADRKVPNKQRAPIRRRPLNTLNAVQLSVDYK